MGGDQYKAKFIGEFEGDRFEYVVDLTGTVDDPVLVYANALILATAGHKVPEDADGRLAAPDSPRERKCMSARWDAAGGVRCPVSGVRVPPVAGAGRTAAPSARTVRPVSVETADHRGRPRCLSRMALMEMQGEASACCLVSGCSRRTLHNDSCMAALFCSRSKLRLWRTLRTL